MFEGYIADKCSEKMSYDGGPSGAQTLDLGPPSAYLEYIIIFDSEEIKCWPKSGTIFDSKFYLGNCLLDIYSPRPSLVKEISNH